MNTTYRARLSPSGRYCFIDKKIKILGIPIARYVQDFDLPFNSRFIDNEIFVEALNDYMNDRERDDLTGDYWYAQFSLIRSELNELERELKDQLLSMKTKEYASVLETARKMMKGEYVSNT